ncbi:hypothetical protein VPH35_046041 [Triticum aestivum]
MKEASATTSGERHVMQVILELPASSGWRGNISKGLEPVKEEAKRTLLMKHEAETKTNAYWLSLLTHMQSAFVPRKRQLGAAAWELRVRGAGHVPGARRDGMGSDHHYQLPATERASRLRPRHDVLPFAPA